MNYIPTLPAAQHLLEGADHFDEKVIEGDVTLREFIAGCASYYPWWIQARYRVRAVFVRLLGMRQPRMPEFQVTPDAVSFAPGERVAFFTVQAGTTEQVWIGGVTDDHLSAYLIIAVQPLAAETKRFHVGTIVHYNNWAGPVYFTFVRPFHHLVVWNMMKAGAGDKGVLLGDGVCDK